MSELDEYLDFAKNLAEEAGKIMNKYFLAEEMGLEIKLDNTPVTMADKEINELVIQRVKTRYHDHGVMGEEDSFGLDRDCLWIVDPLDGTTNFSRRIPLFAFSIALVIKGEAKIAVVYDPNTNRMLDASASQGAHDNGKKITLTDKKAGQSLYLSSWVVGGIDNSIFSDKMVSAKVAEAFAERGKMDVMDFPIAYALALIGPGDIDATVSSIRTPWDVAAGCLIAKESGAIVSDLFGGEVHDWRKEANGILVAAPAIHEELLNILAPVLKDIK